MSLAYRRLGLKGLILAHPTMFVDAKITLYTFLDAVAISRRFQLNEIHPRPSYRQIEAACGPEGLKLPEVHCGGKTFYDFWYVDHDTDYKIDRGLEYAALREVVRSFLARPGLLPPDAPEL